MIGHAGAQLSAVFPASEGCGVRCTDPELKSWVQGFIGLQVTHGRGHRSLADEGDGCLAWRCAVRRVTD